MIQRSRETHSPEHARTALLVLCIAWGCSGGDGTGGKGGDGGAATTGGSSGGASAGGSGSGSGGSATGGAAGVGGSGVGGSGGSTAGGASGAAGSRNTGGTGGATMDGSIDTGTGGMGGKDAGPTKDSGSSSPDADSGSSTPDTGAKDMTMPPPSDAGPGVVWPNDQSKTNSDPWLAQNHDRITQLQPRVLVIDLENTANAQALVDRHIAALKESSSPHKYKNPSAQPALAYQLVKIAQATKGSRIDYNAWNTQPFADSNLQIKDPADPSGPNLTLCGLFEKGIINEVWCMASSDPKCGETQDAKQVWSNTDPPVKMDGKFVNASNGDNITGLGCKVSVRITDFNSGRGTGCHQHAMGHAWERYMDSNAVPLLRKQAARFLNWDLNTRVGAPFSNFYSACNSNGTQLTDCMVWDSQIAVRSGASAAKTFSIADMSAGCGNAHFYANTTGTYSYDANMPDNTVLSSCEHYGLHDAPDGKDLTTTYSNAMTDQLYGRSPNPINGACAADATPACSDDCGGHGTAYLYQNFPGQGTLAKNDDGTPMHNWWVYLFY